MAGTKPKRKERIKQKREEAQIRQEEYSKLTPKQKLDRLDARLGPGVGAKKERARLEALL